MADTCTGWQCTSPATKAAGWLRCDACETKERDAQQAAWRLQRAREFEALRAKYAADRTLGTYARLVWAAPSDTERSAIACFKCGATQTLEIDYESDEVGTWAANGKTTQRSVPYVHCKACGDAVYR